ncbi:MAG: DnaJ domain-containing protein [Acidobacteria bacterium]|nr:DnaJ domain-containing protein [Acidobacteriota bacterium]MCZ6727731.1 DnaJ domain-containing protein [Acidobacteriota bacterium]
MKSSKGFLEEKITRRFYDRIAESLERKPIDLEPGEHRERLRALLGGLGELTFYQLLEVKPGVTEEEIHLAYTELARAVHPSHANRLGMDASRGALELLFERSTEAYLTLNDPDRSRVYQMATGMHPAANEGPSAEQRRKEQVEQAERLYRVSRGLVLEARYHDAVQTLRQTVKLDPKPEYYALLAECLGRNPNWLKEASRAYRAAIELAPHDPLLRNELGLVYERAGGGPRAEEQYEAALTLDPESADAQAGLDRLRARRLETVEGETLWTRLTAFFKRPTSQGGSS